MNTENNCNIEFKTGGYCATCLAPTLECSCLINGLNLQPKSINKMKAKKCKVCGNRYTPKYNQLEPCPTYECRLVLYKKADKKLAAMEIKRRREEKKALKEQHMDYKKILQSEVQKIARLIDFKCLCLARNIVPRQAHGGHLFSRGSSTNISFNLHNIFLQAASSNHFQSDDLLMRDGVVRVFGQDYLDFITSLKSTPTIKYTNEEYKEFLQKARKVSKQLSEWNNQLEQALSATSRIQMRNWANVQLGIYPTDFLTF